MSLSEKYQSIAELRDVADILRAATDTRRRATLHVPAPFVPASTDEESRLVEIWREVLSLDEVGLDDNFFELGGDSLHMTQVFARILDRLGREVPVDAFFAGPTVRQLAAVLAVPGTASAEPIDLRRLLALD